MIDHDRAHHYTQLQSAVEDLLPINRMRRLTAYLYPMDSLVSFAASTTSRGYIQPQRDTATVSQVRFPDCHPEKVKMEERYGHSLFSNPIGSLGEVTNFQEFRATLPVG